MLCKRLHLPLQSNNPAIAGHQYPFCPSVINISLISVTAQMDLAVCLAQTFPPQLTFHWSYFASLHAVFFPLLEKNKLMNVISRPEWGSLLRIIVATCEKSDSNQNAVGHAATSQTFVWRHNARVLVSTISLPAYDNRCQIMCVY